jgi:hypothetical protein
MDRAYHAFLQAKRRRPIWDVYAAFQPFNEAQRPLLRLAAPLLEHLRPGDLILDVWSRTGWSAVLLAALFPEQTVVAGVRDTDVLGTRGAGWWLANTLPNLRLVAVPADTLLPHAAGPARLIHGHDQLHDLSGPQLAAIAAAGTPDAVLLFTHVHLANSEPTPFFERPGCKRTGTDCARWLADHAGGVVHILPEDRMLSAATTLPDEADCIHYNATVLRVAASWEGRGLSPQSPEPALHHRAVFHPLARMATDGTVIGHPGALGGGGPGLLQRHPLMAEHLAQRWPLRLSRGAAALVHGLRRGATLAEAAIAATLPPQQALDQAGRLAKAEALQFLAIPESAVALQRYYAEQRPPDETGTEGAPALPRPMA